MLILTLVGIVPGIILVNAMMSGYRSRAVSLRTAAVQNQCKSLITQIISEDYIKSRDSAVLNGKFETLSNVYGGRIQIIDKDFRIIWDTFDLEKGKYNYSEVVVQCFNTKNSENYADYDKKNHVIIMTVPIEKTDSANVQGVMLVSVLTTEIDTNYSVLSQRGIAIEVLLAVLIIVLAYVFSGMLVRPFSQVTKAIEDMTDGFLDENISVKGYTETELISDAFNRMLSRVKTLDDSRQEFVSNVSHELKTPLTSMKVLADSIVGQENVPVEIYQEFMQDITAEIDRENKIITDLLSLVKLDKKAENLNIELMNINELLELILKRLRPIAATKGIELILDSFRPVNAEVDEVKLTLAISNLIENAIKYNVPDGWVRVSLNADHKYFYVTVADSGIGIPEESINQIFERFYRVDKSHSTEIDGSGLGLAITRSTIVMHRGAIKVYSKEKEGTTFSVRIPLIHVV